MSNEPRAPMHSPARTAPARRALTVAAALLALGGSGGCKALRKGGPAPEVAETTVRVENRNFLDVNVYVVRSGQRVRLGTVTGNSTQVLRVPTSIVTTSSALQFLADPIGGRRSPVSEEITVSPGDQVVLVVPPG